MRKIGFSVIALGLVVVSGCAPSQTYRKDTARLENSISDLRSYQAEQTTQISTLQSQIHKLSGKVEELEYLIKRRTQSPYGQVEGQGVGPGGMGGVDSAQGYNPSSTGVLSGGLKAVPPSIVPLAPLEDDETFAKTLPANASRVLSQALSKVREGNFQESLSFLQQLIQQGEKTEWSPNVLFWLGVTYDGLGEDKNALRAYNDLIVQFPRHKRIPLALYRQSQNLQRLGDKKSANLLLRKIVSEYPDTSEGTRAKEDLKKF